MVEIIFVIFKALLFLSLTNALIKFLVDFRSNQTSSQLVFHNNDEALICRIHRHCENSHLPVWTLLVAHHLQTDKYLYIIQYKNM